MNQSLDGIASSIGVFTALLAIGRYALIFSIDAYYDALAHVRRREAALPAKVGSDRPIVAPAGGTE